MINISISTNLLVIISCFILALIIGLIVYIIYKDRKIDQEEIDDLIEDIVNAKPRKTSKEEVKVKQIETAEKPQLNLEQMLNTMQADLEKKHSQKIEKYETEQEENAIISIKELEKSAINNIENYEKEQEQEAIINYNEIENLGSVAKIDKKETLSDIAKLDLKENISSIAKLEEKEELIKKPSKKKIAKVESNDNHHKFKNTEFISPIFGKMEEHINYPTIKSYNKEADLNFNEYFGKDVGNHVLEQTFDIDPLSDEIKKNTEFLKALKEFRSNL